jgi:hypothetical protein
MTIKVEPRYIAEIQSHIEKLILSFGKLHSGGQRNEDCVIALMVLKGLVSGLLASMAKVIDLDKDTLLKEFVDEVKDQFEIFNEFERKEKKLMN